jgi:hypothetical protein
MATSGGQKGNKNAQKGTRWRDAINRALDKRSKAQGIKALDELAERLLKLCDAGDISALKELGDRLDGKPAQAITGEGGGPMIVKFLPEDADA